MPVVVGRGTDESAPVGGGADSSGALLSNIGKAIMAGQSGGYGSVCISQ